MTMLETFERKRDENPFLPLATAVQDILAEKIVSHEYRPGQQLTTTAIATELQISRTPVNAALNQLVEEGLIKFQKNKGFFVAPFEMKEYLDYLDFRAEIEVMAGRLAIELMTQKDIDQLERYKEYLVAAFKYKEWKDFSSGYGYHEFLVTCSRNPYLISAFRNLIPQIRRYQRYFFYSPEVYPRCSAWHEAIFMAIKLRDAEAVEANIRGYFKAFEYIPRDVLLSERREAEGGGHK